MILSFIAIPLISALIGWITNVLAIKLIFRPLKPVKIPFIKYSFQGLIPKRRSEIAATVGKIVEEQLLSIEDVIQILNTEENKEKLLNHIIPVIKKNIREKFPPFIPSSLKDSIVNILEEILKNELEKIADTVIGNLAKDFKENVKFEPIIEEKINSFEIEKLEALVLQIASRELKHIELLGGVLGFIIGLVQLLIVSLTNI